MRNRIPSLGRFLEDRNGGGGEGEVGDSGLLGGIIYTVETWHPWHRSLIGTCRCMSVRLTTEPRIHNGQFRIAWITTLPKI